MRSSTIAAAVSLLDRVVDTSTHNTMRSSQISMSGMPTGKSYMGWWGSMGGPKQKGIVTYSVSPYRQRAFQGVISGWIFNGTRRLIQQSAYFLVPLSIGYGVYSWGSKKYAYNNSKEGHHAMHMAEHAAANH
ncbi:cytochrome b-c1 complex subunit 8 [Kockovaella imperatae]|uniref:Cytochrome b-c1 complex subunit 8 n=1 Tax=Kockovaella imperatae TaxID=4999 RepID=A0A1Y1UT90_9TREE|nr:cytochrome b-c1 complex subunit 8 [Kockovaella imperatae]ORX40837.1 cytochrome b-c1 complex subunit 8 [Kockovaella imperatae]